MNKYFDYAATALPNMEVIQRLLELYPKEYLFGNPSSNHNNGINAKILLENARKLTLENTQNDLLKVATFNIENSNVPYDSQLNGVKKLTKLKNI